MRRDEMRRRQMTGWQRRGNGVSRSADRRTQAPWASSLSLDSVGRVAFAVAWLTPPSNNVEFPPKPCSRGEVGPIGRRSKDRP